MRVRHAPADYVCTFCRIASGSDGVLTTRDDVVLRTDEMTAFVASHWWPTTPGHVLVIPNEHIENLYEFPARLGGALIEVSRRVAIALKSLDRCDGVSTRQHNEPAGNQDVWHFHQHVFPRFEGDDLYLRHREKAIVPAELRAERAAALRQVLVDVG